MEFGRVSLPELDAIDFTLPAEPVFNTKILTGNPVQNPKVYIGCAKWGRKEWVGKLYPVKTKKKDFLDNYVKHYNSIELNATHYKLYDPGTVKNWSEKAGQKEFLFCPKMYQGVTHSESFTGKESITAEFFKSILAFGNHLGPIFIQVSESFAPKRKKELFDYLGELPKDLWFFVEVRHREWFGKEEIWHELLSKFRELNIGAVITDTGGRRDCAHMHLTVPKAFIRFVGNSLHETDYKRIDDWVKRIKYWLKNGLEELYFFMHMHNEALSPELTVYLADKLNKECGLNLACPTFISKPNLLFQ